MIPAEADPPGPAAPSPPRAAGGAGGVRATGTRERLVRAAVRLFQERGYHGAGTADVLAATAAPRGSLYHHFPGGKAELGAAAAAWIADEVTAQIALLAAGGGAPAAVARGLGAQVAAWLEASDYRRGGLLATLAGDAALAGAVAQAYRRIEWAQAALLEGAGVAPPAAAALARALIASVEGGFVLARCHRDAGLLVEQVERVAATMPGAA